MALSLDSLPFIVLLRIREYLDRDYTSTLVAFAHASQSCDPAATSLLFRSIKFSTPSHLSEGV